jgi:predicted CopG family antitoxin
MNNDKRVQVMLTDDVLADLKEAAKADRRSVSEYLRILIEEHLEKRK